MLLKIVKLCELSSAHIARSSSDFVVSFLYSSNVVATIASSFARITPLISASIARTKPLVPYEYKESRTILKSNVPPSSVSVMLLISNVQGAGGHSTGATDIGIFLE